MCFSVVTVDYYPQQKQFFPGGNALNQALKLAKLGHQCAFIGTIGTDAAGNQIVNLLKSHHVDISHLYQSDGETANNQIINDEFGERFGVNGAWCGGVYDHFHLKEPDWFFMQTFDIWVTHADHPDFSEILTRKRDQILSVDFLHLPDIHLLEKSLDAVNLAFIGGTGDMEKDLSDIAQRYSGIIILTLGEQGSIAFHGKNQYRQKALPVERIMDTTGCGDAFQAVFLHQYLSSGDISHLLAAGAKAGQQAAAHYGGSVWQ